MLLNLRKYYRPRSLEAALRLLSANPARCFVLAGGTHLVPAARRDVEEVVDLSALKLRTMKQEPVVIRIGSMVTLQMVADNPRLKKFAGGMMSRACRSASVSRMIRNQRTIGGEIIGGFQRSDLAAVLLALEAGVKFVSLSMEGKEMPLAEFWSLLTRQRGKRPADPPVPGVLLEILIPRPSKFFLAGFERIAQIESQPTLMCVAAAVQCNDDQVCVEARIATSSLAPIPQRLSHVESFLKGKAFTTEAIESASALGAGDLHPFSDQRVSAQYRQTVLPALLRRALTQCLKGK